MPQDVSDCAVLSFMVSVTIGSLVGIIPISTISKAYWSRFLIDCLDVDFKITVKR